MQENSDINREVLNVVKNTHEKAKHILSEHWTSCTKPLHSYYYENGMPCMKQSIPLS